MSLVPDHLDALEAEAVFILREVAAEFRRPALLFSGGKDSAVLLHLAEKAFAPAPLPFPVLHVDTGHNFPEVLAFRDHRSTGQGHRLIVASVQDTIDRGRATEDGGISRNRLQAVTLLDAVAEHRLDVCLGGGRRDEEKARAKERVFSFRNRLGQWDPSGQRPELWSIYNGRVHSGEHMRAFPISNWTELDVWQYIARERIELPSMYFGHRREVVERDGMLLAVCPQVQPRNGEE
ncbi:MAG: sulfate adenylyltransferase subunit CysD, partial [Acidimicrobiales bacterium]